MIGICRYCGNTRELKESHIIPKSFYFQGYQGEYLSISKNGAINKVHYKNGIKEYLLCHDCEEILGIYDNEAKKFFYDKIRQYGQYTGDGYILKREYVNYNKLRKFFISLVWRASISSRLPHISLGKYEDIALKILKDEEEDDTTLFHPFIFTDNKAVPLIVVENEKYFGQREITFVIPNYFIAIITNTKPIPKQKVINQFCKDEVVIVNGLPEMFDFSKTLCSYISKNIQKRK